MHASGIEAAQHEDWPLDWISFVLGVSGSVQ